jgi:transcriptional regulator with XRE-family HTH domain
VEIDLEMLGKRIKAARKAAGLSQFQLAQRVGIQQSRISKLEKGQVSLSIEGLAKVARELSVSLDKLTVPEIIAEAPGKYQLDDPRIDILKRYDAPSGLRDLAQDQPLAEALKIAPREWQALDSLRPPGPLDKDGYIQVLFALRSARKRNGISTA